MPADTGDPQSERDTLCREVAALRAELAAAREQIRRVENQTRWHAERARHSQERAQRNEAQSAGLRAHIASQHAQLVSLNQQIVDLRQVVAAQIADHQRAVAVLRASTSWRITAPLRALTGLARRRPAQRPEPVAPMPAAEPIAPAADVSVPGSDTVVTPAAPRRPPIRHFPLPGDWTAHPLLSEPAAPVSASISVVIPTRDAGEAFGFLLRKLRGQRGIAALQIVVVDSGSTDGTAARAAVAGCTVVPIAPEAFSHGYARNLGARHATGELLLFTVQDAYPVGEDWLAGLARALLHAPPGQPALSAVSCAEFPRADSELLYDALALTHYRFLGCDAHDRIGALAAHGHESLRRQGQLSNVACLIPRALFAEYEFIGRYAEDLTLGIRLLKDGHRLAMLSSLRVVHSHTRPAGYYVRRVFVDVVFLVDGFADFDLPPTNDAPGTLAGLFAVFPHIEGFAPDPDLPPSVELQRLVDRLDAMHPPATCPPMPQGGDFGVPGFADWMTRVTAASGGAGHSLTTAQELGAFQFHRMVVDRLEALLPFVAEAWPVGDAEAARQLTAAVRKTLAMALGAQLAFCHIVARAVGEAPLLMELESLLMAGI